MSSKETIAKIADELYLSKVIVSNVLGKLKEIALDELDSNGEFTIHGLAHFKLEERPAREFRNPQTGGTVKSPAKLILKVKATALQNALNK